MSKYAAEEGRLVYVSNLPDDVRERDIDNIFGKYGRIRAVNIKPRPPPFAFVEFSDRRDASDAVRGRDNYDFYGYRLRVEFAKGRRNDRRDDRRDDRGGDRDRHRDDRRGGREDRNDRRAERRERNRREFRPRNTAYRVLVTGLPSNASWQDLKDFIKKAVRPIYTDVEKDGDNTTGVVGFESVDDMERCISKLDDTKFQTKDGDGDFYVRVMEDKAHRSGGGGGSPRRKSRSRSRSPVGRAASRSRSRTPTRAPSRSAEGRSRSPSPKQQREEQNGSPAPARDASRSPARSRSPSQGIEEPV